ncbi:hypothetical protein ACJX0J_037591, partial [Zea mays]
MPHVVRKGTTFFAYPTFMAPALDYNYFLSSITLVHAQSLDICLKTKVHMSFCMIGFMIDSHIINILKKNTSSVLECCRSIFDALASIVWTWIMVNQIVAAQQHQISLCEENEDTSCTKSGDFRVGIPLATIVVASVGYTTTLVIALVLGL